MSIITIGMPVYNGERWLEASLESIRQQTYEDYYLLVCDNASDDNTEQICRDYAAADRRVRYFRNPENIGANRNYQRVLRESKSKYFKWASGNDICAPTFLEVCIEELERRPDLVLAQPRTALFEQTIDTAVVYRGDVELLDDDPVTRFVRVLGEFGLNNSMNGLIRREPLSKLLPMGSFWHADTIMMAELAMYGKFRVLPEVLFFRRMSKESATSLKSKEDVGRHFDPSRPLPIGWHDWRYHGQLLRVALRDSEGHGRTGRKIAYWLRSLYWSRTKLLANVKDSMFGVSKVR